MNILNEVIEPTTGIPQGNVFGPIFFIYYINNIFTNIKTKYNNKVNIQAFIDDIVVQAEEIKTVQLVFDDINKEISN